MIREFILQALLIYDYNLYAYLYFKNLKIIKYLISYVINICSISLKSLTIPEIKF